MENQSKTVGWAARFFTIWTSQQLSTLGSTLAQFALVWWLTQKTGSATVLAVSVALSTLPNVLVGPFAGVLVDRWPRRVLLIVADGTVALASLALAGLFWAGAIQIWHVYLILLARALGTTFHWPAMTASTTMLVPEERLPRVAGLNQAIDGTSSILAPPLGALLLDLLPLERIMLIDVFTALLAVLPLLFIAIPQPAPEARKAQAGVWQDLCAGFHYVWGWPGLKALILYSLVLNVIVNPPMELLPLLVTQHFRGQALYLGWMNAAWGVGVVAGGLLLTLWGGFRSRIVTMLAGVLGLGMGILLVGAVPAHAFPFALSGLFVGAVSNAVSNASMFAILQSVIAPQVQGRVFALGRSLAAAAIPLGMLIAGPLADQTGVRALFWGAGAIYMVFGAGAFFIPSLMRLEGDRQAQPATAV